MFTLDVSSSTVDALRSVTSCVQNILLSILVLSSWLYLISILRYTKANVKLHVKFYLKKLYLFGQFDTVQEDVLCVFSKDTSTFRSNMKSHKLYT